MREASVRRYEAARDGRPFAQIAVHASASVAWMSVYGRDAREGRLELTRTDAARILRGLRKQPGVTLVRVA